MTSRWYIHRLKPPFLARRFRFGLILVETKFGFLSHSLSLVDHILKTVRYFLVPKNHVIHKFFFWWCLVRNFKANSSLSDTSLFLEFCETWFQFLSFCWNTLAIRIFLYPFFEWVLHRLSIHGTNLKVVQTHLHFSKLCFLERKSCIHPWTEICINTSYFQLKEVIYVLDLLLR